MDITVEAANLALNAIKTAYRRSRHTQTYEAIEGLNGAAGWKVRTVVVLHKSVGPKESLEFVGPDGRRVNVGKGYLPELVTMFLTSEVKNLLN